MPTDQILPSVFLLTGAFFTLIAALGIARFKDFYTRVHTATKASTFGFGFTALAVAWGFASWPIAIKLALAVFFLFVTLPVGAHLLSRAVLTRSKHRSGGPDPAPEAAPPL